MKSIKILLVIIIKMIILNILKMKLKKEKLRKRNHLFNQKMNKYFVYSLYSYSNNIILVKINHLIIIKKIIKLTY